MMWKTEVVALPCSHVLLGVLDPSIRRMVSNWRSLVLCLMYPGVCSAAGCFFIVDQAMLTNGGRFFLVKGWKHF